MSSAAQIRANRANGKLSEGPVTAIGKSISSHNALKHALSGATFLLREESVEEFEKLLAKISKKFAPEAEAAKDIIQTIAETEWRLRRIPLLEAAAFTKATDDETGDASYTKELASLGLHESRLLRRLKLATAAFEKLRHEREMIQTAHIDRVMHSMLVNPITQQPNETTTHKSVGVEFSFPYLMARILFRKFAPKENIAVFDRTWPDKSAQTNN